MYDRKCIDGDSDHQTSTGIQRHRLRALFERADDGNTPEQAGRNSRQTWRHDSTLLGQHVQEAR